jgi:probable addiction module antidote protein
MNIGKTTKGELAMPVTKKYKDDLIESLRDPNEAEAYLDAAIEDGDINVFLLALRDVVEAKFGGISKLAQKTKLNRENLYRILSIKGNPEIRSLEAMIVALGFRLAVKLKKVA